MDILDQSEVDALLNTASKAGGDVTALTADDRDQKGTAVCDAPLPPGFELKADPQQLDRIDPVQVPVIVRLAERQMSVSEILDLAVGTIIEFERAADAELDLVVSNVAIGTGNAVKCGENFGLRVIGIQPWARRLVAAGLYR